MSTIPIKYTKVDDYKGTICQCFHCGNKFGSANGVCANFCTFCKTIEQRATMDAENTEVWAEDGKVFACKFCTAVAESKALQ